jgi:peptidyl-prolyl cis-trans isomerase B (cyclophilin B)
MRTLLAALLLGLIPLAAFAADAPAGPTLVLLETTDGDIYLEMNAAKAPKTVANFVQYVKDGQYDGVIFHRVIPGFMAQGGGYTLDFKEKETREPIENESKNGLSNARGTIAMARTNDPHSASAQWFINLVDNPRLDGKDYKWGYAVFGKVVRGMDVLDAIAAIPTGPGGPFPTDVPFRPVVIKQASVIDALPPVEKASDKVGQ